MTILPIRADLPARSSNPHEQYARERKASAIALHIWTGLATEDRTNPQTPWTVLSADDSQRLAFALSAGQRKPSPEAWWLVCERLAAFVNAERGGAKVETCPRCKGEKHYDAGDFETGHGYEARHHFCDDCSEAGEALCENCRERPGVLSVPLGLYCEPCTAADWPSLGTLPTGASLTPVGARVEARLVGTP